MEKNKRGKLANSHFEFQFCKKENILLNSKRSQGHVEVMLSFVIFIGFLIFTFVFLNPFARTKEPSYIMDNAEKAIINNITDEIGKLSVILNTTGTCYKFDESNYDGNYFEVDEGSRKFTLYFNNMFTKYAPNKKDICDETNYTLGVYSKEKFVIYNKILELKSAYETNYDILKESLGITNDFLFKTRDSVGNNIEELSVNRNIPLGIDVESREIPMRVINNSGYIKELILNIRAW